MIEIHITATSLEVKCPENMVKNKVFWNRLDNLIANFRQNRQEIHVDPNPFDTPVKATHRFIDSEVNEDTDYFAMHKGREVVITSESDDGYYSGFYVDDDLPFVDVAANRFERVHDI